MCQGVGGGIAETVLVLHPHSKLVVPEGLQVAHAARATPDPRPHGEPIPVGQLAHLQLVGNWRPESRRNRRFPGEGAVPVRHLRDDRRVGERYRGTAPLVLVEFGVLIGDGALGSGLEAFVEVQIGVADVAAVLVGDLACVLAEVALVQVGDRQAKETGTIRLHLDAFRGEQFVIVVVPFDFGFRVAGGTSREFGRHALEEFGVADAFQECGRFDLLLGFAAQTNDKMVGNESVLKRAK